MKKKEAWTLQWSEELNSRRGDRCRSLSQPQGEGRLATGGQPDDYLPSKTNDNWLTAGVIDKDVQPTNQDQTKEIPDNEENSVNQGEEEENECKTPPKAVVDSQDRSLCRPQGEGRISYGGQGGEALQIDRGEWGAQQLVNCLTI